MTKPIIRPLQFDDFPQWLPLWDANNLGQKNDLVTQETWQRLCDPKNTQVNGLCAETDGVMSGIVHYILHSTTGHVEPVCYMQDVYVDPEFRRRGIGRALVNAVSEIVAREKWARMYWMTEADNTNAKALYENLGVKLDFTFYVLPIN